MYNICTPLVVSPPERTFNEWCFPYHAARKNWNEGLASCLPGSGNLFIPKNVNDTQYANDLRWVDRHPKYSNVQYKRHSCLCVHI